MASTRTFVAVSPSDETRAQAAQLAAELQPIATHIKWVVPPNLHWTLHFLGDVEDTMLPAVCDVVANAVGDFEPFLLTASGAGAFPSAERPRTLWLGTTQGTRELVALQATVKSALDQLGFRGENRPYVPHLTLGRAGQRHNVGSMADRLAELADYPGGSTNIDEVSVLGSELARDGPTYHLIGRAPLNG
jgi:2'-5' RNA ligase